MNIEERVAALEEKLAALEEEQYDGNNYDDDTVVGEGKNKSTQETLVADLSIDPLATDYELWELTPHRHKKIEEWKLKEDISTLYRHGEVKSN